MSPDNSLYDLARYHEYGSVQASYILHILQLLESIRSKWTSGTIVDIGAGRGVYSNFLLGYGYGVVAQDTSPSAFDAIDQGVTPHHGDIHTLAVYPDIVAYHAKDVVVDHIPLNTFFSTVRELSPIGTLVMLTTLDRYGHRVLEAVPRSLGFEAIRKESWTPTPTESHGDWYKIPRKTRCVNIYQRTK